MNKNKGKTKYSEGFTLAELLIVVAIIAILVAVSIPVFASKTEKAREATCLANKRSLLAEMTTGYSSGEYDTLSEAFHTIYEEKKDEYVCPAKGTFYWNDNGDGTGRVRCTYHDDGQETGDEGDNVEKVPGTNISVVDSYWPTDEDYADNQNKSVTVSPGGVFKYTDGNYYVVTKAGSYTKGQAATGPGGDAYNWFNAVKITNRVVTYSNGESKSDLSRGDVCEYNGSNYVYIDGGSWSDGPGVSPGQWYKIP